MRHQLHQTALTRPTDMASWQLKFILLWMIVLQGATAQVGSIDPSTVDMMFSSSESYNSFWDNYSSNDMNASTDYINPSSTGDSFWDSSDYNGTNWIGYNESYASSDYINPSSTGDYFWDSSDYNNTNWNDSSYNNSYASTDYINPSSTGDYFWDSSDYNNTNWNNSSYNDSYASTDYINPSSTGDYFWSSSIDNNTYWNNSSYNDSYASTDYINPSSTGNYFWSSSIDNNSTHWNYSDSSSYNDTYSSTDYIYPSSTGASYNSSYVTDNIYSSSSGASYNSSYVTDNIYSSSSGASYNSSYGSTQDIYSSSTSDYYSDRSSNSDSYESTQDMYSSSTSDDFWDSSSKSDTYESTQDIYSSSTSDDFWDSSSKSDTYESTQDIYSSTTSDYVSSSMSTDDIDSSSMTSDTFSSDSSTDASPSISPSSTDTVMSSSSSIAPTSTTQTTSSDIPTTTTPAVTTAVTTATTTTVVSTTERLYAYGSSQSDDSFTTDSYSWRGGQVHFSNKVPLGEDGHSIAHVNLNGVITFGENQWAWYPYFYVSFSYPQYLLAPFWSRVDYYNSGATVWYHLYESSPSTFNAASETADDVTRKEEILSRATTDVRSNFDAPDFEASTVLVATWENVRPRKWYSWRCRYYSYYSYWIGSNYYNYCNEEKNELNTFQAVYVTNGEVAYALYLYKDDAMTWRYSRYQRVVIGWMAAGNIRDYDFTYSEDTATLDKDPGNKGDTGKWINQVGKMINPVQACRNFVRANQGVVTTSDFKQNAENLFKCPCSRDRLGRQWWWHTHTSEDSYFGTTETTCYALSPVAKRRLVRLFGNPLNKLCCYSYTRFPYSYYNWYYYYYFYYLNWRMAPFVGYGEKASRILLHDPWSWTNSGRDSWREDMQPHKWCCKDSTIPSQTCAEFHSVRPQVGCSPFAEFVSGRALGDPHITTLDGKTYTMNGYGEYIMLEVPSEEFHLQGRTAPAKNANGTDSKATVFVGFAMKETDEASFQVILNSTGDGLDISANGIDISTNFESTEDYKKTFSDTVSVVRASTQNNKTAVEATFPSGISLKVHIGVKNLEFSISVPKTLAGQTKGMLGNFNNDTSDEFILPDGTQLATNLTERQIFEDFASFWSVNTNNTVFEYETEETAEDYADPNFEPLFREEADPAMLQKANDLCGTTNDACIFDFLATGDEGFANATKEADEENKQEDALLANTPPGVSINSTQLRNGFWRMEDGQTYTIVVKGSDADDDALVYKLSDEAGSTLNVNSDGQITYVANSSRPVTIGVQVNDTKGAVSSLLTIPVEICSGCSGNGVCDYTTHRDVEYQNGNFLLFVCDCNVAWTGADCEEEVDGCLGDPCPTGQNCTDLPASVQLNNQTGYDCGACPTGMEKNLFDQTCTDIDECNITNTCPSTATCFNTEQSYECQCNKGYRDNAEKTCDDIDECADRSHNCPQFCKNTVGSFECECFEGYTKVSDGSCEQDNGLAIACGLLGCSQLCVNGSQGVACTCMSGYQVNETDSTLCIDVNECTSSDGTRPCPQVCSNTIGGFTCSCHTGFDQDDQGACNECIKPKYGENCQSKCTCNGQGICDPIRGCVCNEGWKGQNCNQDVDECAENVNDCKADQICVNGVGDYSCTCPDGFVMSGDDCEDIDECADIVLNDCDLAVEGCVNNVGKYTCPCVTGYTRNSDNICADVNECVVGTATCEQICINVLGAYNCRCEFGYRLNSDRATCEQVDDLCLAMSNLTCSHACRVNRTAKTAACVCNTGYELDGPTECIDVNECALERLNLCQIKDSCVNNDGGFECSCPDGYFLDNDKRSCKECTGDTWGTNCASACACTANAERCDPLYGCRCKDGFTDTFCQTDIDECALGIKTCDSQEVCVNRPGNASCECPDGYTRDGDACVDVDECVTAQHTCKQNCENTPGNYTCPCFTGYSKNTATDLCEDVDECALNLDTCEHNCVNAPGYYRCTCDEGFRIGDTGSNCLSITECDPGHGCSDGCALIDFNNTCVCPIGKAINETDIMQCIDVDLCLNNSCEYACEETNVNTTSECSCGPGYRLSSDGYTCSECPEGLYGDECANTCQCDSLHTSTCDKVNGTCNCVSGWKSANCSQNIDECLQSRLCSPNSQCVDTPGSFLCQCFIGYYLNVSSCLECPEYFYGQNCVGQCQCDVTHSTCNSTDGHCICDSGWNGTNCDQDVDECSLTVNNCTAANRRKWVCKNTIGSYGCQCDTGYYDNNGACEDYNECNFDSSNLCNQKCNDLDGSFNCSCFEGYHFEIGEMYTCVDTDECNSTDTNQCNHFCRNNPGSYECYCKDGYELNGNSTYECVDINECDAIPCGYDCQNTNGSFVCSCATGYQLASDRLACIDVNECLTSPCDETCTNNNGSYVCSCSTANAYLDTDNSTCVATQRYNFETSLNIDATSLNLTTTSPDFERLKKELLPQIIALLRQTLKNFLNYVILSMRQGSLIVVGQTILSNDATNIDGQMVEALLFLASNTITVDNNTVTPVVTVNGTTITPDMDKCTILTLIEPCPDGTTCLADSSGVVYCGTVGGDDDDDIPLIVGLSVGLSCLAIIIILVVVVLVLNKKNKKLTRVASREGHYDEGPSSESRRQSTWGSQKNFLLAQNFNDRKGSPTAMPENA